MIDMEFLKQTFILVLAGIPVTLKLTVVVFLISATAGFLVAIIRSTGNGLPAKLLGIYVSFARGTPAMVQIYLLYSALPTVAARYIQDHQLSFDIYSISGITYAYVIFSFGMIAIFSETFRAGLQAVDKGQLEAAKSIGLSGFQGYYRIVIPQAFGYVLPVMCTNVTGLVKMTSLAFSMSVFEITAIAKLEGARNTRYLEAYMIIGVMYVILNLLIELLFSVIEKKAAAYHTG